MKLIKVEAHGFKSFADPIALKFDGGVAGIIGPNGSGKSNINDAIKWVLGERSAKELRGDNMEDVIFAGSKTAKPMNKAEVTLTFDNRDSNNNIPHGIITISRVLERGNGTNTYYLNGEVCRQKDIKDIAMETGIGKSSLAIISQGTVSDIAEATAEERMGIFEEAAGVSKYKFRKKEAIAKLEKAEIGLEKICLVIAEIEKKLVPLRRQAEKAKVFIAKSEELKQIEVGLLVDNIQHYGNLYETYNTELDGVIETKTDLEARITQLEAKINQSEGMKAIEETELRKLDKELNEVKTRFNNLELILARQEERHRLIATGQAQENHEEQVLSYKALLETNANRLKAINKDIASIEAKIEENNKLIETYLAELNNLSISINKKVGEITKIETHLNTFRQQRESGSLMNKGTKVILESRNVFGKGVKGTVADLIHVDLQYVPAINAILGNSVQNLVVDKSETAVKAVNFLKNNNGGRATFIPLGSIAPKSVRDDLVLAIQGHPGFVGIASELTQCSIEYDVLNKFLLGNVIVASDIESANSIANVLERRYMVVTLEGDIVRVGGVITGGTQAAVQTILGLDEKIKELETVLPGIREAKNNLETKHNEINNYRHSAFELASQYKQQLHTLLVNRNSVQQIFDEFSVKYRELANQTIDLESVSQTIQSEEATYEDLRSQILALETQVKVRTESIVRLAADIKFFNTNRADFQASLNKLNSSFAKKMADKDKSKYILDQSRERLATQYKMTYEMAAQSYKLEMNREQATEIVNQLRSEIEALGSVNLESLEALVEEENRFAELSKEEKELSEAKQTFETAIAEMDKIIITRLKNIVTDVNDEFNNVFKSMFGGGNARLYFDNPNNILESGVEIEAQPPGKSVKNLKLFSGGEKSLIAISLLFGILKARPLPLCILDEVEAALDEANVVRYAEYLQALKEKTQFLVITHRHGTMSRVDTLFGATMQTRGVTSFFSLKLEDAKKLVADEQKDFNDLEKGTKAQLSAETPDQPVTPSEELDFELS
ncbi:AAA family ATPase [Mycoplasmopsis columbinasalis]|uniref:Chromosome partition protein Smc n=1 Tax=Mycoplasmopsis columbinasalis TaxID=114880 RepID=A0A449BAL2_9BACT|nr:AAA family ATPase [Mycoplasmopsis columbinasalis]VEU78229.1 ABC transporter ATP-binding protein [Mycoplasmopsis columbinasalis]